MNEQQNAYREHLERNLSFARERVRKAAVAIAEDMGRFAWMMESAEDPIVSEIGELQSRGPMFDTACARSVSRGAVCR
jgi:hypothetical protein